MTTSIGHSGKSMSVPGGLALAAAVSISVTAAVSGGIAYFINSEKITWIQAGYWIMGMLFAASFLGAKSAYAAIRRQRLMVSALSGLVYWGLLLCVTALFFGGDYEAVGETAGIILAGTGCAAILTPKKTNHFRKKHRV